ncbi:unnamed protein product [Medioppia subpectinata]|uniref:Ras-associating domain-containing protein n=1 Tax=Medioppia subpectinata TaxID=1979941 RepID=A0A7R9PW69_9ACAR|nr:unnamed protein product [Medioppia subpectinata]CAG2103455.1 unnamed protein product [Medioppia subpectinata]
MLKHVSNRTLNSLNVDTISINSSVLCGSSNGSNNGCDEQTSRSSRSSSSTSIHDLGLQKVVIKIYSRVLCSDVEYKTLSITSQTTSKQVARMLLNKFRLKQRDPNLFYLTLEVWIRQTGIPIRSVMVLDDDTCPALLQSCYPQKDLKFSLMMRCGGLIKIYDSCLMSGSLYKSLLLSDRTTVDELIQLLLNCYNLNEKPSKFALYEVCPSRKCERKLCGNEIPLAIQSQWPNPDIYVFQLRKNTTEEYQIRKREVRELPWSKTCDRSGNVMFHLNSKDEVNSKSIHSPTLKPSFNNYENYFYI